MSYEYCPGCERMTDWETETETDPAAPHREKTVTYCTRCGEVM